MEAEFTARKLSDYTKDKLQQLHFIEPRKIHYLCEICCDIMFNRWQKQRHLRQHKDTITKYKCSRCKKLYARKHNLQTHSQILYGFDELVFEIQRYKKQENTDQHKTNYSTKILLEKPKFRIVIIKQEHLS